MKHPLHWRDLLRLQLGLGALLGVLLTNIEMKSVSLMELSSLAEDIQFKKRKASQNTDLEIREFLEINKASESIQGGLLNNTQKLKRLINA